MTTARLAIFAVILACAVSAYAQSTRPSEHRDARPDGPFRRGNEWRRDTLKGPNANVGGGGGAGAGGGLFGPMTDDEKGEIEKFMKSYSPRRWEKFQDVPDERKDKILSNIRTQYHWMQRLKDEDPKIYDIRLKRLPIEDDMFALGWELHHGEPKAPDELRKKLREKVRQFVRNSIEERQARLDRWRERLRKDEEWLNKQQAEFDKDAKNMDTLVDKGIEAVENERPGELKSLAGPMLTPRARPEPPTPPASSSETGQ